MLAQIIERAVLQRSHRDLLVAGPGQEDDRRAIGAAAQTFQPVESIRFAQYVVKQHDVVDRQVMVVIDIALRYRIPFGNLGVGPFDRDVLAHQQPEILGVINHQHV